MYYNAGMKNKMDELHSDSISRRISALSDDNQFKKYCEAINGRRT
jgi:hypothetical protein